MNISEEHLTLQTMNSHKSIISSSNTHCGKIEHNKLERFVKQIVNIKLNHRLYISTLTRYMEHGIISGRAWLTLSRTNVTAGIFFLYIIDPVTYTYYIVIIKHSQHIIIFSYIIDSLKNTKYVVMIKHS